MKDASSMHTRTSYQRGAVAIMVGLLMAVVLVGFAALAVDIGHLAVVRNELQNAADAGALAGARFLYNDDGMLNLSASTNAHDAATANNSDGTSVEVNGEDVQIGHWSFTGSNFTPYAGDLSTYVLIDLWDVSTQQLDVNPNFINAVRVITRRSAANSFFARIFGHESFNVQTDAVAYLGFAGHLMPDEADQPLVICADAILNNGVYSCNIGRMINSGQSVTSSETGGWTDFNQDNPCSGGTNANIMKNILSNCDDGNPEIITYGEPVATNGGQIQSAFSGLLDCWENASDTDGDGTPDTPWNLTLPVVTCPGNNVSTCEEVVGAVNVSIVWIQDQEDPHFDNVPWAMGDWSCIDNQDTRCSTGEQRWSYFVEHFNLVNVDGTDAPYQKKAVYFLPTCEFHEPTGRSGGQNFGILAKIPVLVE